MSPRRSTATSAGSGAASPTKSPRRSIFAVAKELQLKKGLSNWRDRVADFFGVSDDAQLERWHRVFDVDGELEGSSGGESEGEGEGESLSEDEGEGQSEGEGESVEESDEEAGLTPMTTLWANAVRSLVKPKHKPITA